MELAQQLLTNPVNVNVTPKSSSVERIVQRLYFVERASKLSLLQKTLAGADVQRAIVFAKTKRGANMLAERLHRGGQPAAVIHGNKSQNARQRALDAFKNREVQVLVATDIAARGIDIDGITHVVNYDMPVDAESYVHRIGRTARAGAEGIALSFCSSAEMGELREIEQLIGQPIPPAPGQVAPRSAPSESRSSRGRTSSPNATRNNTQSRGGSSRNSSSGSGASRNAQPQGGQSRNGSSRNSQSRNSQPRSSQTQSNPVPVGAGSDFGARSTVDVASSANSTQPAKTAKRPLQRKIRRLASGSSRSR